MCVGGAGAGGRASRWPVKYRVYCVVHRACVICGGHVPRQRRFRLSVLWGAMLMYFIKLVEIAHFIPFFMRCEACLCTSVESVSCSKTIPSLASPYSLLTPYLVWWGDLYNRRNNKPTPPPPPPSSPPLGGCSPRRPGAAGTGRQTDTSRLCHKGLGPAWVPSDKGAGRAAGQGRTTA